MIYNGNAEQELQDSCKESFLFFLPWQIAFAPEAHKYSFTCWDQLRVVECTDWQAEEKLRKGFDAVWLPEGEPGRTGDAVQLPKEGTS